MRGKILIFVLMVLLIIPISSAYDFNYYLSDAGNDTQIDFGLWLDDYTNCVTTEKWYYDNASSTMLESRFYDPYTTFEYYINPSISGTSNCLYVGKDTQTLITENLTHRITMDYVTNTHLDHSTTCPTRSANITINSGRFHGFDSLGYIYNTLGMATVSYYLDSDTFGNCIDNTLVRSDGSEDLASAGYYSWFLPFTATYGNHYIGIASAIIGGCPGSGEVSIYQLNDSSIVPYTQSTSASYTAFTEVTNLIEGYDYVLVYRQTNGGACGIRTVNLNYLNITVLDYYPDITCSSWSDCDNETDTISRLCSDGNGIVESYYEYDECNTGTGITAFDEFAYFGFRNLTTMIVPICVPQWDVINCVPFVVNKTVTVPDAWELVTIETMDNLLSGQSPYRIRSWIDLQGFKVKIWNAPPKPYEARFNHTGSNEWECINMTEQTQTWEYLNTSNDTVATQFNITFPYENSKIWYTVRKCSTPAQQFKMDDCAGFWGIGSLGDFCYSSSCDDDVKGGYDFEIWDYDNSEFIFRYNGEATGEWRQYYFDLGNLNMTNGTKYKFQFKVSDPDYTDIGTCIELWDFGYGISSSKFTCESYCNNENFHYFRSYLNNDGLCITEDIGFSTDCIENDAYVPYIENCEAFCDSDDSYHVGNNVSGICYWTVETESTICATKITPVTTLIPKDIANQLEGMGLGIVLDLATVFGIMMLILAIICFIVTPYFPPMALLGMMFLIFMLTSFGYIPMWITGAITITLLLLFARFVVNMFTGGNNETRG